MNDFNQRKYQTVIMAALLHDVGKMLHRGTKYSGEHFEVSARYIEDSLKEDVSFYNLKLLVFLVRHHHSTKRVAYADSFFNGVDDCHRNRFWQLLKIVKKADSYSCAERDQCQRWLGFHERSQRLDSIFSRVRLQESTDEHKKWTTPFQKLHPLSAFPVEGIPEDSLDKLIEDFETTVSKIPEFSDFDSFLNCWTELLEDFTWSVPSDTRYEYSDVSLFDHLRSSAALAACLYKRHIDTIDSNRKTLDGTEELVLVGGDYSGIQEYIFGITAKEGGGVSKRLRARSFFVAAFCEATAHKILHSFDLPLVCNVFSSGGKFLLLVPQIKDYEALLEKVRLEIEEEIHRRFFSQFTFLMCWKEIERFKLSAKVYNFFAFADKIFHQLESRKLRKSGAHLLSEGGKWNEEAFKATAIYEQYDGKGDCKICGRGPAVCEEEDDKGNVTFMCKTCHRDKFVLGQELPKRRYAAFCRGKAPDEDAVTIFDSKDTPENGYYVRLLKDNEKDPLSYLVYDIGNVDKTGHNETAVRKHMANYVPTDNDGRIKTFEQLAAASLRKEDGKEKGSEMLGILKADIDNLGLIFSKGFNNPDRSEKGLSNTDRKTMSRFLTMSRMIDIFFAGWVKEVLARDSMDDVIASLKEMKGIDGEQIDGYIMRGSISFRDIYTVYSGGDDMVLVGPWETMIVFAIFLNQQFRKLTCDNKDVTLSAGLALVKPRYPIADAVRQADELLERSKSAGKNSITLFGTTVEWGRMPELVGFFLKIDERINDDKSNVKTAFLHRLLEYHRHALDFMGPNKKVEGLRYLSMLSYDMGRNFLSKDVGKQQSKDYMLFEPLITMPPKENHLMKNLKIPLFWALLGNR